MRTQMYRLPSERNGGGHEVDVVIRIIIGEIYLRQLAGIAEWCKRVLLPVIDGIALPGVVELGFHLTLPVQGSQLCLVERVSCDRIHALEPVLHIRELTASRSSSSRKKKLLIILSVRRSIAQFRVKLVGNGRISDDASECIHDDAVIG